MGAEARGAVDERPNSLPRRRVGVVVPAFNAERYVLDLLGSLQAQSYSDWEAVVVDDGSTDATGSLVAGFADQRVRLVRQVNRGTCPSRNLGYSMIGSDAEFVAFVDADDVLEAGFLSEHVAYLDDHPEVAMTYCSFVPIDGTGMQLDEFVHRAERVARGPRATIRRVPRTERRTTIDMLLAGFWAIPSCTVIRRSAYDRTAGWDESVPKISVGSGVSDDQDMALQLWKVGEVHFLDRELVRYRRHDSNLSSLGSAGRARRTRQRWWDRERGTAAREVRAAVVFDASAAARQQLTAGAAAVVGRDFRGGALSLARGARAAVDAVGLWVAFRLGRPYPMGLVSFGRFEG